MASSVLPRDGIQRGAAEIGMSVRDDKDEEEG